MKEAIAVDFYNLALTGGHESTISDYTAIVMVQINGRSEDNRESP